MPVIRKIKSAKKKGSIPSKEIMEAIENTAPVKIEISVKKTEHKDFVKYTWKINGRINKIVKIYFYSRGWYDFEIKYKRCICGYTLENPYIIHLTHGQTAQIPCPNCQRYL